MHCIYCGENLVDIVSVNNKCPGCSGDILKMAQQMTVIDILTTLMSGLSGMTSEQIGDKLNCKRDSIED